MAVQSETRVARWDRSSQGRRNEMKGAGAKLQKGQFLQIKGRSFCQLVGGSAPTPPAYGRNKYFGCSYHARFKFLSDNIGEIQKTVIRK